MCLYIVFLLVVIVICVAVYSSHQTLKKQEKNTTRTRVNHSQPWSRPLYEDSSTTHRHVTSKSTTGQSTSATVQPLVQQSHKDEEKKNVTDTKPRVGLSSKDLLTTHRHVTSKSTIGQSTSATVQAMINKLERSVTKASPPERQSHKDEQKMKLNTESESGSKNVTDIKTKVHLVGKATWQPPSQSTGESKFNESNMTQECDMSVQQSDNNELDADSNPKMNVQAMIRKFSFGESSMTKTLPPVQQSHKDEQTKLDRESDFGSKYVIDKPLHKSQGIEDLDSLIKTKVHLVGKATWQPPSQSTGESKFKGGNMTQDMIRKFSFGESSMTKTLPLVQQSHNDEQTKLNIEFDSGSKNVIDKPLHKSGQHQGMEDLDSGSNITPFIKECDVSIQQSDNNELDADSDPKMNVQAMIRTYSGKSSLTKVQTKVRLLGKATWHPSSSTSSGLTLDHSDMTQVHDEDQSSIIEGLFCRLGIQKNKSEKLKSSHFLDISKLIDTLNDRSQDTDLVYVFMKRLLTINYTARNIFVNIERTRPKSADRSTDVFGALLEKKDTSTKPKQANIHPMDVQMAVFHCADHFLQQVMVTKLSESQYAIPLLVPNPFTRNIEFSLWTVCQIKKSWKTTDHSGKAVSKDMSVYKAETPMVAFFRLGSVSLSKSQLMNNLINEKHNTFFHRHCSGSSRNCLLMEGVVEIAWYCPSGNSSDHFSECVAFCNLHGDASDNQTQREIITQMASVNVVILSSLDENEDNMAIVKDLCIFSTPLIVLLTDEDDDDKDAVSEIGRGKYRMGLKGRNQANVSAALRSVINDCLLQRPAMFRLENISKCSVVSVDENNETYRRGKEAAQNIMRFLEGKEPSKIKETYLPCQGKLWHDWCQKSKELRLLQSNTQAEVSRKQFEKKEIRWKQQKHGFTELMGLFVGALCSLSDSERIYFLQWTKILLDELTVDKLAEIHQGYDKKWTTLIKLKNNPKIFAESKTEQNFVQTLDKLKAEQSNLENISQQLYNTTFGLEHMLREMGQIYEASVSEKKNLTRTTFGDLSYLSTLAAELLISGHPMELMDGDTAYVPLIWVSAVLDEVIRKLGDPQVFVLSVLGIQSSGKSTMLNAMFGLQFAVSAGRCTKGAFMQLVRVSEEMKKVLKFDYILVIDTEGLRALELAGNNTIHHDNELSTFVVGVGNLTLVNILGENPCEMQEILQIVVHAILRMKQVRLNPSCMFVHQNVSDIAAREKIMEGKRRLQETLDRMTKLAAKDGHFYAENFTDVIKFDVEKDVKYFAQLWEGSPPMAPPNPRYSENIQELKQDILLHANTNGLKLSQFQKRVKDLWEALLDENFVFSFKNAHEISVYRKLEQEYGKWAWSLRSAMLGIEDKLLNRVASGRGETIQREDLMKEMADTLEDVQKAFSSYFEEDNEKETLIQWKCRFETQIRHLYDDLINDAKRKVDDSIQQRRLRRNLDQQRVNYEERLFEKSKELALKLKGNVDNELNAKAEFDSMWKGWVSELTNQASNIKDVDISMDVTIILGEFYGHDLVGNQNHSVEYKQITTISDYNSYIPKNIKALRQKLVHRNNTMLLSSLSFLNVPFLKPEDNKSIRDLILKTTEQIKTKVESFPFSAQGYNSHYIQEILHDIKTLVQNFELDFKRKQNMSEVVCVLKKAFYVDLSLHVFDQVKERIAELHRKYKEANDPVTYFEKKKPKYFKIFQKYWKGATSAAILGDQVCSKLEEAITQSVYNMVAKFVCGQMKGKEPFNGNRADLEKYILKALVEQPGNKDEKFHNYLTYMYYPRYHFQEFIKDKVKEFMAAENPQAVSAIEEFMDHKQRTIISAAKMATAQAKYVNADTNKWLHIFSYNLADELGDVQIHLCDKESKDKINYDVLVDIMNKELSNVVKELKRNLSKLSDLRMEKFRERPDKILIKHFCRCCWEQCPFCGAVCTNSQKDHPGDHNADFHRTSGLNGLHHKDTTEFFIEFCTAAVASDSSFYPTSDPEISVPFKQYRTAEGKYANWLISTDLSELAYWKWFICEFQENLEKHQNKKFYGNGKIPDEWKHYTQLHAVASLGLK